ncbi:MAG TPA: cytochrome c oxidase assembly protein [Stellaceae bacterium]
MSTPYCGPPPLPTLLAWSWNLDPVLIAGLAILAIAYAVGCRRLEPSGSGLSPSRKAAFYLGWLITALGLLSPLCPLSVSLFSARVGQHMILTLLAAPLVVAGRPVEVCAELFAKPSRSRRWLQPSPLRAAGLLAALLWFWHAPAPYAATFHSALVYWAMHLTVFGSALWLWDGLFDLRSASMVHRVAAGVVSSMQMSFLGALITLAPRSLYMPHAFTTAAWGLTPLQDQQLGGGIMWVPGCLVVLAISLLPLWPALAGHLESRSSASPTSA